jgi:uncharacterized membrane protein
MSAPEQLWRAVLIGAASGGRSQTGVAAVALRTPGWEQRPPAAWLASSGAAAAAVLAAVGELGLDKYPGTPSRLSPLGLPPRLLLGGFAAAALAVRYDKDRRLRSWAGPAAIAAAASVAGAFAGARWRAAVHRSAVPDWVGAVAEDAVVIALAAAACAPWRPQDGHNGDVRG